MPLIKSGSRKAISQNIKTEMGEGGRKQDQAVAIALNIARKAKRRARGGPVGYYDGREVDDIVDGMAFKRADDMGRLRRRTQALALAGREPAAEDIATLEAYKPELLNRQMGMLSEAAPAMLAGPVSGAIGPGLSAVKAHPGVAATTAGLISAFAPSAMGQGDRMPAEAQEDMARFMKGWQEVNPRRSTNRVKAEDEARRAYQESDIGRRMNDPKTTYSASAKARFEKEFLDNYFKRNPIESDESVEDYAKRGMAAWNDRRTLAAQDTAAQRAEQAYKKSREDRSVSETPFEETWWGRNVNPTETPLIVGGVTGLGLGLKDAYSGQRAAGRWETALNNAEKAVTPVESLVARSRAAAAQDSFGKGFGYRWPLGLGMAEGLLSTALPIAWNRGIAEANPERRALEAALAELPAGHPDRYRYEPRLNDEKAPGYAPPVNPAKTAAMKDEAIWAAVPDALMRAGLGASAALTGSLPGKLLSPSKNRIADLNARTSQAAMSPEEVQQEAKRMFGVKSADQAYTTAMDESRTRALKIARDLAEARQNGTSGLQTAREADELAATAGAGSLGSPSGASVVRPETVAPLVTPIRTPQTVFRGLKEDPAPLPESSSSQASQASNSSHYRYKDKLGRIGHKDEETHKFVNDPRKPRDDTSKASPSSKAASDGPKTLQLDNPKDPVKKAPVPRTKTERTAEEDLADPGKLRRGEKNGGGVNRATGGMVDHALAVAGRYSTGGHVHVGAVAGTTEGRADKRPVNVPAGSFVIPADTVAALGEGNSLAGYKNLDKMFGGGRTQMATGGQAVPIKISDGEYVISPAAVSKIGNGDMDMGHRTLDKFVLAVRKQHINQLKTMPPPAR